MKFNLIGIDGNAFSIIGYVLNAMRIVKKTTSEIEEYTNNATSKDYNHLLTISIDMIDECNKLYEQQHTLITEDD